MAGTLEPIAVSVTFFSLIMNEKVAQIVGPYSVILVVASVAAGIALGYTEKPMDRWWKPLLFMLSAVMMSFVLSVNFAQIVSAALSWGLHIAIPEVWFYIPASILIAGSRDYWLSAASWAWGLFKRKAGGESK